MAWSAYLFEAKSIQSYLSAGGRLRDMVAASSLVDGLCRGRPEGSGLADDLLDAIDPAGARDVTFLRRAAGALAVVAEGETGATLLGRFAALWPMVVGQTAPGLDLTEASGRGPDARAAMADARNRMLGRRSFRDVRYPLAPPVALRARRTGLAAAGRRRYGPEIEYVDDGLLRKARHDRDEAERVGRRFMDDTGGLKWPREIDLLVTGQGAEPDRRIADADNRTVAVVHADGNRMGQIIRDFSEKAAATLDAAEWCRASAALSAAVQGITEAAARTAATPLAEGIPPGGHLPMRPLVLGGDDVSLIIRGDLALGFAARYLEAFERIAGERLPGVFSEFGLGQPGTALTACAGIAFIKAGQPFHMAHELAEGLCRHSKTAAKADADGGTVPSALSYHRVTATLSDSYRGILQRELSTANGDLLTMNPYVVGQVETALPRLDALGQLKDVLADEDGPMGGVARQLMTIVHEGRGASRGRYARWIDVQTRRSPAAMEAFLERLRPLVGKDADRDVFAPADGGQPAATPVGDCLNWIAIEQEAA